MSLPGRRSDATTRLGRLGRSGDDAERLTDHPSVLSSVPGAPPQAGQTLGDHEVVDLLGAGGMGEVLLVRDEALEREVAAKVVRGEVDEQLRRRFVLEARVTGQLAHPNIVPVHQLGRAADGRLFFTMQRVQGQTLEARLAREGEQRAGLVEQLGWFLRICDAIRFAHSRGVVHRDLKPANVMVGEFGEVLVMDWGLAKVLGQDDLAASRLTLACPEPGVSDAGAGIDSGIDSGIDCGIDGVVDPRGLLTMDGAILGTPAYMPPEQARGEVDQLDQRADIYSLGAILYELLTGRPPFDGDAPWTVVEAVAEGRLAPPRAVAPDVPWELEAVCLKALAYAPEDRYSSVEALRRDVAGWLEGRPLAAASYSPWQLLRKWAWRRRAWLLPAAALLLAAAVVGGVALVRLERKQRELAAALKRQQQAFERARLAVRRLRAAKQRVEAETRVARRAQARAELAGKLRDYERLISETRSAFYAESLDIRHRLDLLERALEALERLGAEVEPDDRPDVDALLGIGWYYVGDGQRAEAFLQRAHRARPEDPRINYALGNLYADRSLAALGLGDQPHQRLMEGIQWGLQARKYLDVGLAGLSPIDRHQGALMQAMLAGQAAEARRLCDEGLRRFRGQLGSEAYYVAHGYSELDRAGLMQLMMLMASQQWERARPLLTRLMTAVIDGTTRALEVRPHFPQAHFARGSALETLGNRDAALKDYDAAIAVYPRMRMARLARARLRLQSDPAAALDDVEALLAFDPTAWEAYVLRSTLRRRRSGRVADLERALIHAPAARQARVKKLLEDARAGR